MVDSKASVYPKTSELHGTILWTMLIQKTIFD